VPVIESFQTMSDSGGIRHQIGSGARAKERNRTLDWEGINSESLRKLKRARGNKKGLITKAQDEIRDLMTDLSNTSLIKDRLLLLNTLFEDFAAAHATYHNCLEDECDIDESNEYYNAVEQTKVQFVADVARWILSQKPPAQDFPRENLEIPDDVTPVDSISNVGSRAGSRLSRRSKGSIASSVSSARAKAAAKRAALEAEAANLENFQAIEKEELCLQQRRQALQLNTDIAKAQAEELAYTQAEAEASCVGKYQAPSSSVRNPLSDRLPEFVEAQNLSPLPSEGLPEATVNPYAERAEPLNPNGENWVTESKWKPKIKQEPVYPAALVPSEMKNEERRKADFFNSPASDSLVQRLFEVQHQQNSRMQELIQRQQESTLALTLPQPVVPTFSGNPIDYWPFIKAFENLIETKTPSESARLYYLVQYTTGEVQELVKSCLTMRSEDGYREARSLIKKRYGQGYRIACAFVDKLANGPPIKSEDGDALRRFSTTLTGCKNTLKEIGYLSKIENPNTLKAIVNRLPFGLRQRWRDVADNITETQEREITVEDLSNFVTTKARAANHAVFGDLSNNVPPQSSSSRVKTKPARSTSTFATQTRQAEGDEQRPPNPTRPKCPLCNANHWLSQCDKFRNKSLADRVKFVRTKNLCNNCLVAGHLARSCPKPRFCRVTGCQGNHSSFLHPPSVQNTPHDSQTSPTTTSTEVSQPSSQDVLSAYVNGSNENVSQRASDQTVAIGLAVLPVKVKAPGCNRIVETYAFLDTGSNASFCSVELAKQLHLSGQQRTLTLTTMEKENSKAESHVVSLEVLDLEEENMVELPFVFTRPKLPVSTESIASQADINRWPHLAGIDIPRIQANVGLLIGCDASDVLEPKEIRASRNGGPYATRTIFGWVVNGPLGRARSSPSRTANFVNADLQLNEQFQKYCDMEFNDSVYSNKSSMSSNDRRALDIMKATAQLKDGHYEIALPWISDPPCLENNRSVAEHRLKLLKKRLLKDAELLTKYRENVEGLLKEGYAVRASTRQAPGRTWYLPHHPVFHPAKPGKIRVVFDCSAKFRGSSLNDHLLQGPDLTNSLVGVLIRFRQERVALMSDIESMFHQVKVRPEDCSALRFLWWPNGDLDKDPEELMMKVHLFGGISSPSCANFALRKTAHDHRQEVDPEIVSTVERNFYVDDCLKSVQTPHFAVRLVQELTELLKKGGFRLTKWVSNSREVVESIPEKERATSVKNLDFEHLPIERALGIQWHVSSDTFGFKITIKDKPATRRGILSIISSVYDPLGFVGPFILPAKIILQDLCKKKLGWDDKIPEEDVNRWKAWLESLPLLERFCTERCCKPTNFEEVTSCQLHYFSDASQLAYGAVSYLRMVNAQGDVHCSFVMGKSRLAPLKPVTIPRMELSAAVLSTRLDRIIRDEIELPIQEAVYWTDSTCVLRYIENDARRYQTFVANRVSAIREQSSPCQWKYVDTKLNPADDASRGMTAEAITEANRWINGPDFLWQDKETWPKSPIMTPEEPQEPCELPETKTSFSTLAQPVNQRVDEILQRFSSWLQLKRCIAWMLRFKNRLRNAVAKRRSGQRLSFSELGEKIPPLDVLEVEKAENAIIKYVQSCTFQDEMLMLRGDVRAVKKSSCIVKLDPILVNGILRVGGRLHYSLISSEARHPAILPKHHYISNLIAQHYHRISGHSGLEHTLSLIRQRYWIIQARVSLRRIISSCFSCRRRQASVAEQKMSSLPEDRVNPSAPPFSHVGVDCFGPIEVKRGRSMAKRYGVLFTCMSIRAIHIEVAYSLDTDAFINALRRFIARRGEPLQIRSDNGGNFVKGEKELRQAVGDWNQDKIHNFLLAKNVKWIFNPPAGSHHGGVWERCIRTVRKVAGALLKEQPLDDEGLLTLMCEVESIINGRPITKVSDDPKDLEALTPNHLLLLRAGPTLPPGAFTKEDNYSRRRWRQVQYLADVFWRRWIREYLPTLQERRKWNRTNRNFAVNDVVLVVDESLPRSCWPLARILEVYQSRKDGLVRSVKVKMKSSTLVRPIDKIVLLEAA